MDKAIIFGTYGFIGYSTCMKLLEEGLEVEGYRIDLGEPEVYIENKKLMIGRNSNFQERILEDGLNSIEINNQETILIISYYDFFYSLDKKALENHPFFLYDIGEFFRNLQNVKLVCLFPYEFLNGFPSPFKEHILSLNEANFSFQSIFLPTIFGPWQPSSFLFQQYFLKKDLDEQLKLDEREYTLDALYLDDVVENIFSFINSKETKNIVLQNEEHNMWLKCAEYLNLQSMYRNNQMKNFMPQADCQIVKVRGNISFKDALEHQKTHTELLEKMF